MSTPDSTRQAEPFTKALERMNRFQEPEAHTLIADLQLPEGSRGLDVGCGVGLFTLWLADAVGSRGHVLGIEPPSERVEAARALVGHVRPPSRLEFREGDALKIDAPDGAFDWIWCGDVLHHIQETGRALGELARVVRPGGRIIVKESQLLHALFLPGHPVIERRIRAAEAECSRHEGGEFSFEERRQRSLAWVRGAGLSVESFRTYLLERRAPLPEAARDYIQRVVFDRTGVRGSRIFCRLRTGSSGRRSAMSIRRRSCCTIRTTTASIRSACSSLGAPPNGPGARCWDDRLDRAAPPSRLRAARPR